MRKNALRVLSLLLALMMLLSLCGCAGERGGERPSRGEATEAPENAADEQSKDNPSPVVTDNDMYNDPAIVAHYNHNTAVSVASVPEREATQFHLYVPSTETMTGFVNATTVTAYQDGIQSVVDTADNLFTRMFGHALDYTEASSELVWTETELDGKFTRNAQSPVFYEDKPLPTDGALPMLFQGGNTPFAEDGLTVIVSNFVEPGFDVSCIAAGIEDYFDAYPKSGACIIGFTSDFDGEFHIPQYKKTDDRSTLFIHNFEGSVPCYIVVVGPLMETTRYAEQLFKRLDNRKIEYYYEQYSNNVYEEHFANKLVFDVVPAISDCKATYPVLDSYNTGVLTERETGNAYFATAGGASVKDASTRGSGVSITKSTQIALISTNYDGESAYAYDYTLYIWDNEAGTWAEAGKNAEAMVYFTMEPQSGAVEGMYGTILSAGRREMYVSALLDFGPESTLSRDNVYRLEVRIHLNQENGGGDTDRGMSKLIRQSITSAEYFEVIDELCIAGYGNKIWTGTDVYIREKALGLFRHTPNLDSLLLSLSEMEGKYETHTEKFTYLDFVFNIKDKDAKR